MDLQVLPPGAATDILGPYTLMVLEGPSPEWQACYTRPSIQLGLPVRNPPLLPALITRKAGISGRHMCSPAEPILSRAHLLNPFLAGE